MARPAYSHKVDVFSFAILAYEVLARRRAYDDVLLTMDQVARNVSTKGLRPPIPRKWPPALTQLLEACWSGDAAARPEFDQLVERLEALLSEAEASPEGQPSELLDALAPARSVGGCCVVQ